MFLCVSDCSSAHTEYQLFGLYAKSSIHNIPFSFKIFSILTHIKFYLLIIFGTTFILSQHLHNEICSVSYGAYIDLSYHCSIKLIKLHQVENST